MLFGIGEIYEHRALEQFAARLRLRQRIQVDRPCRPPLLDTQPDQVGGAGPFQHLKGQHRAGEESAETNANQHDMNNQPGLQAGNRRRRAAVSVVNGRVVMVLIAPEPGDRLRIIDVSR
ncbi:Uncharacterised protein [Klebsiella pneumoniae]|uniref:Uncharacterized protein n=1 Tax=Klebsiella pneumoniae TaxID=573 RepID=A0A377TME8_KLEPN|nr:Uncharacterised protein [Klebsiella pneumoniae]